MKKAKLWSIGTNIQTYIDEITSWINIYDIKKGDNIFVISEDNDKNILFKFKNNKSEIKNISTGQQFISILLMLGFITPIEKNIFNYQKDLTNGTEYKVEIEKNLYLDVTINYLQTFDWINKEVDGEDFNVYKFPQHKNALFSMIKAFEIYYTKSINSYPLAERKIIRWWTSKELFSNYETELIDISINILDEFGFDLYEKEIDNSSIKWKDMVINKLESIQNKDLDSKLWNLADVIESGKSISIPIMQRKYVWDDELAGRLLDDIFSIDNNKKPLHYIGSIVYKERNNALRILDGQQRLTTMFLILLGVNNAYRHFASEGIEMPLYFKGLFPQNIDMVGKSKEKPLVDRFIHISGNGDMQEFHYHLTNLRGSEKTKTMNEGNISHNADFIFRKICDHIRESTKSTMSRQLLIDSIFLSTVERTAFTANKNQIESEYLIFEKLNTLSKPLNQIDLLKNYLLPFCIERDLDMHEPEVQTLFDDSIYHKFMKNGVPNEARVKKFIQYYISLHENKFSESLKKKQSPWQKFSIILQNKYNHKINSLKFEYFDNFLRRVGDEIQSFISITDRAAYTKDTNEYYAFSDLLQSFDQRYAYAPLIKYIFDRFDIDNNILHSYIKKDREKINKIRKILFEIEKFELYLQVVLYRGQSLTNIISKIISHLENIENIDFEIFKSIFNNSDIVSKSLLIPTDLVFKKKISNEQVADKVSILILNRLKFNEKYGSIEINNQYDNYYLPKPSREHIMPQTVSENSHRISIFKLSPLASEEKDFSDEEFNRLHKSHLDMIGNILIINQPDNSELFNKRMLEKIDIYNKKTYLKNDPAYSGPKVYKNLKTNDMKLSSYLQEMSFDNIKKRSEAISDILFEIYS